MHSQGTVRSTPTTMPTSAKRRRSPGSSEDDVPAARRSAALVTPAAPGGGVPDDVLPLVLRQLRDPVAICRAGIVARAWRLAAEDPVSWALADVGGAVRRYVSHHRCAARDEAVAAAGRGALARLKAFRAFAAWRAMTARRADGGADEGLDEVWAPAGERKLPDGAALACDVSLDTQARTLGFLVDTVLRGLGHEGGNVSFGASELIFGTAEEFDEDVGAGAYARNTAKTLADWGVGDGAARHVDDDSTDLRHTIVIHQVAAPRKDDEGYTTTITLRPRLAWHRGCGRERLRSAHRGHDIQADVAGLDPTAPSMSSMSSIQRYSPEDGVSHQDTASSQLADEALKHVGRLGSVEGGNRLRQLVALDLRELGMHCGPLHALYRLAAGSLRTVNLDRCRVVDSQPGDPRWQTIQGGSAAEQTEYKKLRALMVANGVAVSDVSDIISLNVRNAAGVQVFFKMKARSPLAKLMDTYAQRHGGHGLWDFFYRPDEASDAMRLTGKDTPRAVGIPQDGTIEAMPAHV